MVPGSKATQANNCLSITIVSSNRIKTVIDDFKTEILLVFIYFHKSRITKSYPMF